MRKKITTYIEEGNIKKLKQIALDKNCSMADIIDDLTSKYLNGGVNMNNIIGKKWGEIEKEQKEK